MACNTYHVEEAATILDLYIASNVMTTTACIRCERHHLLLLLLLLRIHTKPIGEVRRRAMGTSHHNTAVVHPYLFLVEDNRVEFA